MTASANRICLCTLDYPPVIGGVAVASTRLAAYLAAAGYDVHVVTPVARPGAHGEIESADEDGVRVHRVVHEQPWGQAGLFALRRFLSQLDQEIGFNLFHGFFLTLAYPCLDVANRGRSRPVIASIRGSDVMLLLDQPPTRALLLPVLRRATWITSVNDTCLSYAARQVPIEGRTSVIRNAIDRQPDGAARWELTSANRGVVGTVGEFRKVKDIPLLIRAYAAIAPALRRGLLLAGFFTDVDEKAWSATLVDELGIATEATVTGRFPHADVGVHLARMHVYVQASAEEGLPNSLLEAASRGVPIVATAVGGMKEVLVDGDSALLVPHGDRDAMARGIARVLEDDALARRLSNGAHALAAALSPERERDAWLALYRRLIDGAGAH